MAFLIEDGKGRGFKAEVNASNELVVRAIQEAEIEHASDDGEAYAWHAPIRDIDTGDTFLFVKNLSSEPLHLNRLVIAGSNVICQWNIGIGSATTTPAGTSVVGVNMNQQFSTKLADAVAFTDETAVADATVMFNVWTPITNTVDFSLNGIILGQNHYIQINQETESTSGSLTLIAHFG
ncbi:hypothetical protein IH781_00315 [Patescibacteria group bacterium]|nr:hypothetical protein [Patescibacteria group bacterium]